VREELDGLISLSDEAIEVLENKVMLELGPTTAPPAPATSAPASGAPASPTTTPPTTPASPGQPVAEPLPAPAPQRPSTTPPATWPVPSRGHGDAPGRVVHPKPHR
jgi:hypothetical protein